MRCGAVCTTTILNLHGLLKGGWCKDTSSELEEMWKGCYHDKEVRESVEEFLSLEESL